MRRMLRSSFCRPAILMSAGLLLSVAAVPGCGGSSSPANPTPTPTPIPSPSPAVCTYTVSPTSIAITAGGGSSSVTVTAASNCNWSATSNANWITVTAGSAGSGNGQVSLSIAANAAAVSRTGTISIAQTSPSSTSATAQITQAAAGTPSGPEIRGNYTLEIQAAPECQWPVATHRWAIVFGAPNPFELENNIYSVSTGSIAGNPDNLLVSVRYRLRSDRSEIGISTNASLGIPSANGYFVFMSVAADGGAPANGLQGRGEIVNAVAKQGSIVDLYRPGALTSPCIDPPVGTNVARVSVRPR